MRREIELAATIPGDPPGANEARRALRQSTDALIEDGLEMGDLQALAIAAADTMLAAAAALRRRGLEPGVPDLVAGAARALTDARDRLDSRLMLDAEDTAGAAVGLHVTVVGVCALLGIDYAAALRETAAARAEGRPPVFPSR